MKEKEKALAKRVCAILYGVRHTDRKKEQGEQSARYKDTKTKIGTIAP